MAALPPVPGGSSRLHRNWPNPQRATSFAWAMNGILWCFGGKNKFQDKETLSMISPIPKKQGGRKEYMSVERENMQRPHVLIDLKPPCTLGSIAATLSPGKRVPSQGLCFGDANLAPFWSASPPRARGRWDQGDLPIRVLCPSYLCSMYLEP